MRPGAGSEQTEPGPSTQDTEKRLRDAGVEEQLSRDLARDIDQLQRQQAIDQQTRQQREQVSEALQQAAEQLDPDSPDQIPHPKPQSDAPDRKIATPEAAPQDTDQNENTSPMQPETQDQQLPSDVLRQMAQRQQDTQERRQISDTMRQTAKELADKMSPEQRRRWSERFSRQRPLDLPPAPGTGPQGTPRVQQTEAEVLDLRGQETGEEVIASWLGEDQGQGASNGTPTAVRQRTGAARRAAQRAVNDAAIPSRYHDLINRYFGRLDETIDRAATGGTAAPTDTDSKADDS
jgi:hypothetical protein